MDERKRDDIKKEIRSVLLTYQDSITLDEFLKTYRNLVGQQLPSRDFGFSSDVAFLKSMPDVVDLQSDSHDKVFLSGIVDKTSQHIQKLVNKQRKAKSNSSKCKPLCIRHPARELPSTLSNTREVKLFLPDSLRAEILELMNSVNYGLTLSEFASTYIQAYNKFLPLVKNFSDLETMIKLIPELEIRKNDNNEIMIYNKNVLNHFDMEKGTGEKIKSLSRMNNANLAARILNDLLQNYEPEEVFVQLLEVCIKYNSDLIDHEAQQQDIWRKIANEVQEECSVNCDEIQSSNSVKQPQYFERLVRKKSRIQPKKVEKRLTALKAYNMYKEQFFCSNVSEESVWQEIAKKIRLENSLDEKQYSLLNCQNFIFIIWRAYERMKSKGVSPDMRIFFEEAKKTFENAEYPGVLNDKMLKYKLKRKRKQESYEMKPKKRLAALKAYNMYKEQFSSPNVSEENVWEEIAQKVRMEFSLRKGNYSVSTCRQQIASLKHQYEKMKKSCVINPDKRVFFEEGIKAFETTKYPDQHLQDKLLSGRKI